LIALHAFLRRQAASYFHMLKDVKKDSYAHLISALHKCSCPKVAREQHYHELEQCVLRPNEEPSLFLWDLRQLLDRGDPDLTEDAKTALLSRQFTKGLPCTLWPCLLESDSTPTLAKMTEFFYHFWATHCGGTHNLAAVCSSGENNEPLHTSLLYSVNQLTAAVAALTMNQDQLRAVVEEQHQQQPHSILSEAR